MTNSRHLSSPNVSYSNVSSASLPSGFGRLEPHSRGDRVGRCQMDISHQYPSNEPVVTTRLDVISDDTYLRNRYVGSMSIICCIIVRVASQKEYNYQYVH